MIRRIVIGIVALSVTALIVFRIVQATAEAEAAPDVEEIRQQEGIPVEVVEREFTGSVRGIRSATVRARTGDEIVEIPVRVGQMVSVGDVVLRQSSEGSQASVRQAEAVRNQAARMVDRLRPLMERGAVSEQDWDNANTALEVAEANLDAAQRAIVLTSPIDGVVTDILETQGSMPESGDPLLRISDLSSIQVLLQLSPDQVGELALGEEALMPAGDITGRVTRVGLQADPRSRLVEVEVTFPTSSRGVIPGALTQVRITIGEREGTLLIPRWAVSEGRVWVIDGSDRARSRQVAMGLTGEEEVEILSGLEVGDRVVVAGGSLLTDGALTRIVGRRER